MMVISYEVKAIRVERNASTKNHFLRKKHEQVAMRLWGKKKVGKE